MRTGEAHLRDDGAAASYWDSVQRELRDGAVADIAHMRWVVAAYESAQELRIRAGEQIRAVVQGRDRKWLQADVDTSTANDVLADIRGGAGPGPVPLLGLSYLRAWEDEQRMLRLMREYVALHPAWPWLKQVKGIGPTLAARLLSRLDIERARHPSSFWAYCGLSTVPGGSFACARCGLVLDRAADRPTAAVHRSARDGSRCTGALEPIAASAASAAGARVAQPRPRRGESSPYDRQAKVICYLIGISFVRQGGAYRRLYTAERDRLALERSDWAPRRRHLTALRKTEKRFLTDLWLVWRTALDLPLTRPHGGVEDGDEAPLSPWSMVDGTAQCRSATPSTRAHPVSP